MEPNSSSFLGLPYRVLSMMPKKELLWSRIVVPFWGLPYRILSMMPKKELLWSRIVVPFWGYLIGF